MKVQWKVWTKGSVELELSFDTFDHWSPLQLKNLVSWSKTKFNISKWGLSFQHYCLKDMFEFHTNQLFQLANSVHISLTIIKQCMYKMGAACEKHNWELF